MLSPIEDPETDDKIDVVDINLCKLASWGPDGGKETSGAIIAPSGYPIPVVITFVLYPLQ